MVENSKVTTEYTVKTLSSSLTPSIHFLSSQATDSITLQIISLLLFRLT